MEVSNNFLGYFYNKFDFIIRFLYCKLPFISRALFWKLYSSDFKKLEEEFKELDKILKNYNFKLKDTVCLELGPGNSYINAYNFLMNGAKKVILVDKYPRQIKSKKQRDYFNQELEYVKKKYGKDSLFFIKNNKIDENYIEFKRGDLSEIDINQKVDFVYSSSVFEHIKNVEANIRKLNEIMEKKGLMYHKIDMRDHYNFNNPFLFYKYSNKTWNKYLTKEGISYTNRLRYNDFRQLFSKYKFKIVKEVKRRFSLKSKKIHIKFQNKDLDIGILKILVRK